jgi:hypothetical protein
MSMKELAEWFGVEVAKFLGDVFKRLTIVFSVSSQGHPASSILVCGIDLHPPGFSEMFSLDAFYLYYLWHSRCRESGTLWT